MFVAFSHFGQQQQQQQRQKRPLCVRLLRCILQTTLNIHQKTAAKATTYANSHSQLNMCNKIEVELM